MKRIHQYALSALTEEEANEAIWERLENGEPTGRIAADLYVKRRFLLDWLDKPENAALYARSRARAALAHSEAVLHIADNAKESPGAVMKAKLQINARQWIARCYDRKTFGENNPAPATVNLAVVHADVIRKRSADPIRPVTAGQTTETPQTTETREIPAAACTVIPAAPETQTDPFPVPF